MNLRSINEAFKRQYSSVLTESVDDSEKAQLRNSLIQRTMQEISSGRGDTKNLEVAMQDEIEKFFPDKCWWEVTDCNIFMELFGGANPREVCDMIVDQLKSDHCDGDDCPQFVDTRKQSIISGDSSMDIGCDLLEDTDNDNDASKEVGQELIDKLNSDPSFSGNPFFDECLFAEIGYRLAGSTSVDYDDDYPRYKTYWFTLVDKDSRYKFYIESTYDTELQKNRKFYLNKVEEISKPVKEAVSNPDKTTSKIDKNLAKAVDKDMVRDLTLIIENDGDVYRRFTTPVIANLKKKRAKGNFDDKLAIQAFVHVVENALRQPYFYRYYSYDIKSVPVAVRYAVAKELLDGSMDEIEFQEGLKTSNRDDKLTESTFRGVPGTEFISHGSWNDPEISTEFEGKTYVANYWDVENSMYSYYKDEKEYAETHDDSYAQDLKARYTFDDSDEDFNKFLVDNADSVITDIVEAGKIVESVRGNRSKRSIKESKKSNGIRILSEDVKVYRETNLTDFDFWSGALDRVKYLTDDELIQMSDILCELNPDGMTETEINDIFWFEEDWIAEMLGFESFEEIENRDIEESLKEKTLVEEPIYDLDTHYDSRKSFYSKAKVDTGDKGDKNKLYSYNTLVAEIVDGKPVVHGTYSATTLRHIKEWLRQLGYRADSAKQIMQDYGAMNESMFDDMEPDVWEKEDEEFPDSLNAYDTAHIDIADRIKRKGYIGGYSNIDHMTPIDSDSSNIILAKKRKERLERKRKELLGV